MPEYEDFDIDRSTEQAWREFETRLSEVVSVMDDSHDLTIGTASVNTDPGPYVTFHSPAKDVVRAEAASNAVLGEDFQLAPAQLDAMADLGWKSPTTAIDGSGSANFWVELSQEEFEELGRLAVSALRDVYGVQHPIFLAPDQLAEILQPAPEPIEGTSEFDAEDVVATIPASPEHLQDMVERELTEMFGHHPLRDDEGDIAVRVGSTMVFLRTSSDGHEIIVFSAVVHDVEGRSRATEVLNDLNVDARWVKFQMIRDRVFVTTSVQAHPFVPAHLHQAVRVLSEVADGIDNELAAKLRGRTTFDDHN